MARNKKHFLKNGIGGECIWFATVLIMFIALIFLSNVHSQREKQIREEELSRILRTPTLASTVAPTITPKPVYKNQNGQKHSQKLQDDSLNYGEVRKVGEYTYEGKVGCDDRMATAQEIYEALNHYRQIHGRNMLAWNGKLAEIANMRARQITANGGKSDQHAGFKEFISNQENFVKVGFRGLSENTMGGGCPLLGVHIIEWIFARDKPHNDAQLDPVWTAVGIGVDDTNVGVIFGADPI